MQSNHRQRLYNKKEPVVEDLREKLNRKRQEKLLDEVKTGKAPPPDPAYNFLRDPLRGDEDVSSSSDKKSGKRDQETRYNRRLENSNFGNKHDARNTVEESASPKTIERSPRNAQGNYNQKNKNQRGQQRQQNFRPFTHHHQQSKEEEDVTSNILKQPTVNIKVEVSSTSGERKCTLDAERPIQIPVSTQKTSPKPQFRKIPSRESQKFYSSKHKQGNEGYTHKNMSKPQSKEANEHKSTNKDSSNIADASKSEDSSEQKSDQNDNAQKCDFIVPKNTNKCSAVQGENHDVTITVKKNENAQNDEVSETKATNKVKENEKKQINEVSETKVTDKVKENKKQIDEESETKTTDNIKEEKSKQNDKVSGTKATDKIKDNEKKQIDEVSETKVTDKVKEKEKQIDEESETKAADKVKEKESKQNDEVSETQATDKVECT